MDIVEFFVRRAASVVFGADKVRAGEHLRPAETALTGAAAGFEPDTCALEGCRDAFFGAGGNDILLNTAVYGHPESLADQILRIAFEGSDILHLSEDFKADA